MTWPAGFDIARGIADGHRVIRQFGRNDAVGGTFVPIVRGGNYRTPQVSGATTLRIKSGGNANDTATGTGARAVTLVGLDAAGRVITETLATAGASASAATTQAFLRLTDAFVSASGTYASQTAGSHAGTITIENGAGGTDWAVIADTDIARADAEIGVYSVPVNRSFYLMRVRLQIDEANKSNVVLFRRTGILQTAAPYDGMVMLEEYPAASGSLQFDYDPPIRVPQLSDVGLMAKSSSSTITVCATIAGVEVIP